MNKSKISQLFKIVFNKAVESVSTERGVLILLAIAAFVILLCCMGDNNVALATAVIVGGAEGGSHIVDGPVTTQLTNEASPSLLQNEVDRRIVKIRPMATPIDQISRWAGCRQAGSMVVDYYSVDTKETKATIVGDFIPSGSLQNDGYYIETIKTSADRIFEPSETLLLPTVEGYNDDGTVNGMLVLYVVGRDESGLRVIAINGKKDSSGVREVSPIEEGSPIIRMGRAATELDVQTAQFSALPKKASNFCQIFKAQIEQSTFQKIADKEVGWDFSDQEEVAIIDMRLGMEKNFLFGRKCRFTDPDKNEEVLLTDGIWYQAARTFSYSAATDFSNETMIKISRAAFTENAGSKRKILIAGSDLIEKINNLDYNRVISAGETVSKWGIDFNELHTKFGTLYILHSEIFDECGHSADGMVIDPEYIQKYCHLPFRAEKLDLKKSGVRNTDAVVLTEASCLVLRYPGAHLRIQAEV